MNDKDKEAFDEWFIKTYRYDYHRLVIPESVNPQKLAWQSACEYKQEEIEELEAENAKLREYLEFTTHAAEYLYKPDVKLNKGMTPMFYFTLTYEGDLELMEKTKRARQVLKELESK